MLQERVDLRKYLYNKELGSKITYLTEYQDLVSMQQDLIVQKSQLREADAAVAASEGDAVQNRWPNTATALSTICQGRAEGGGA